MSENNIVLSQQEIEDMINRAAKQGAKSALADIGLADDQAVHDIHNLRSLLNAINQAKCTVWKTVIRSITMGLIMLLITGFIIKLKLFGGDLK